MAQDNEGNDRKKLTVLAPEVLEMLKPERSQIDINLLLVQVVNKAHDPAEMAKATEQLLELTRNFEHQRVEDFMKRSNAIIDIKTRDPDEIDKRSNNMVRRSLKILVALMAVVLTGGGICCALRSASIMATGLMLLGGIFCVALIGMLASGESVSSNDVVRVLSAVRGLGPQDGQSQQGNRGKGRR